MNMNYKTIPLTSYDPMLQARAAELIKRVEESVGSRRVRVETGSYSILAKSRNSVAAKIIICAGRRSKMLQDGVYVLTTTPSLDNTPDHTMAIGPWWRARYRYSRIRADQSSSEIAILIDSFLDEHERGRQQRPGI